MGCFGPRPVLSVSAAVMLASGCGGDAIGRSTPNGTSPPTLADGGVGASGGADASGADAGKATRLTVSGSFQNVQVWDVVKRVGCVPAVASDGKERCLPSAAGPSGVLFTDSGCTHAVISFTPDACDPLPMYAAHLDTTTCARRTTAYALGSPIDAPAAVYGDLAGSCGLVDGGAQGPLYEALPSDPTEWVELAPTVTPVTDALAVATFEGADGSVIPDGLRLLPSGTRCAPYPDLGSAGPVHCIPTLRAQSDGAFADAQCSNALFTTQCSPADIVELDSTTNGTAQFFETGSSVARSSVFTVDPSSRCTTLPPTSPDDQSYFYTAGAPLELGRYPELALGTDGAGRIRTEYVESAGKNVFAYHLYDSKYAEQCTATKLADGGTWCVLDYTMAGLGNDWFADADCTVRVGVGSDSTAHAPCGLVTPEGSCGSLPPVLYTVLPYDGPVYQRQGAAGAACVLSLEVLSPDASSRSGNPLVTLGAPLDPSRIFAPAP